MITRDLTEEDAEDRVLCGRAKFIWDEGYLLYCRKIINKIFIIIIIIITTTNTLYYGKNITVRIKNGTEGKYFE